MTFSLFCFFGWFNRGFFFCRLRLDFFAVRKRDIHELRSVAFPRPRRRDDSQAGGKVPESFFKNFHYFPASVLVSHRAVDVHDGCVNLVFLCRVYDPINHGLDNFCPLFCRADRFIKNKRGYKIPAKHPRMRGFFAEPDFSFSVPHWLEISAKSTLPSIRKQGTILVRQACFSPRQAPWLRNLGNCKGSLRCTW